VHLVGLAHVSQWQAVNCTELQENALFSLSCTEYSTCHLQLILFLTQMNWKLTAAGNLTSLQASESLAKIRILT
jgi:hypothetical protein